MPDPLGGNEFGDGLSVEVLSEWEKVRGLTQAWDRLARMGARPEVFHSFAWHDAAWSCLGEQSMACVVHVHNGLETLGLLPLQLEAGQLRFLGSGPSEPKGVVAADYNDLLAPAELAGAILAVAFEHIISSGPDLPWRRYILENVPEDGNFSRRLQELPSSLSTRFVPLNRIACPTVRSEPEGPGSIFDDLAKKSSLRRKERALRRRGQVEFEHIEDRDTILEHLPLFFAFHTRRWHLAGVRGQFLVPVQEEFFYQLVRVLDPRCILRFAVLRVGGVPVGYHLGFQWGKKLVWYKPAFDIDLWDFSPGLVLIRHLLRYCAESGLEELDFTVGGEEFKGRFANHERVNLTLAGFRERSSARVATGVHLTKRGFKATFPGAWDLLRLAVVRLRSGEPERAAARRFRSVARRLGRWILRRQVLRWHGVPSRTVLEARSLPHGLELCSLGVSDLVDLALSLPHRFPLRRLQRYRTWVREGGQPMALRQGSESLAIGWVMPGTGEQPDRATEGPPAVVSEAVILRDYSVLPAGAGKSVAAAFVRALGSSGLLGESRLAICVRPGRGMSLGAGAKAGLAPEVTEVTWTFLNRFSFRTRRQER